MRHIATLPHCHIASAWETAGDVLGRDVHQGGPRFWRIVSPGDRSSSVARFFTEFFKNMSSELEHHYG